MRLFLVMLIYLLFFTTTRAQDMHIIQYTLSSENFTNPERGFYHQDAPMWLDLDRVPQSADDLRDLRQAYHISMVRYYFLIDEFRDMPISDEALAYIQAQFDAVRDAGFKMIPRFAYNFPQGGEYPYQDPDAPLDRVLAHIQQLMPILRKNADVIAFMEIGFVGAWGEWHSSTNGLVDEDTGLTDASRAIIEALLSALPAERMIAMRYLYYKMELYGEAPLTSEQAFSGTAQARMGHHNDCFLASATNWGSYFEDATIRQQQKDFLHYDNLYLPQGGETCNIGEDAQPYVHCDNALQELAYLRFSTLNHDYHPDVLALWAEEGCYDEIAMRLGYRLRLIQAEIPRLAVRGDHLKMTITLQNDGFASPYNPRLFELILRASDGTAHRFALHETHDPRRWSPDLGMIDISIAITLPDDMPMGDYELLLNLPDPAPRLYANPDYSIRFANADIWEAETGFNRLLATITIE